MLVDVESAKNHPGVEPAIDTKRLGLYYAKYLFTSFPEWPLDVRMTFSLLKQPSAFLPMAMSLIALGLVLGHIAIFGVVREADEGTTAHLWQLLMAGQVPVVAYFALKWLPQSPGKAMRVIVLQFAAALVACAPVYWFKL